MDKILKKSLCIMHAAIIAISFIFLIISFFIKDIPANESYKYKNNRIEIVSWHNFFEIIVSIFLWFILIFVLVSTVIHIIMKLKKDEKITGKLLLTWFSGIICFVVVLFSDILVAGVWSENDYNPVCYEFSDGKHVIVIEEKSFLLYGGGTIYQILNDNEAVVIGKIGTDDGGRNNGNYDIVWYDNKAEISYNSFTSENSNCTEIVFFE